MVPGRSVGPYIYSIHGTSYYKVTGHGLPSRI